MNPPPRWSDPWWRWFLTIALASVVTTLMTGTIFLIANWRISTRARRADEQERRAAEREQRINSVVDTYVRIVTTHPIQYQGVHALLIAGVKRLRDNGEIQEALRRSADRAGQHPLGGHATRLDSSALMDFFLEIRLDGLNVVGHNEALSKYSAKP